MSDEENKTPTERDFEANITKVLGNVPRTSTLPPHEQERLDRKLRVQAASRTKSVQPSQVQGPIPEIPVPGRTIR